MRHQLHRRGINSIVTRLKNGRKPCIIWIQEMEEEGCRRFHSQVSSWRNFHQKQRLLNYPSGSFVMVRRSALETSGAGKRPFEWCAGLVNTNLRIERFCDCAHLFFQIPTGRLNIVGKIPEVTIPRECMCTECCWWGDRQGVLCGWCVFNQDRLRPCPLPWK